jgi:hypothetical protein
MQQVTVNQLIKFVNAICKTNINFQAEDKVVDIHVAEKLCEKYRMDETTKAELLAYLYLGVTNKALKKQVGELEERTKQLEKQLEEANDKLLQLDREWLEYDTKREAEWNEWANQMEALLAQRPKPTEETEEDSEEDDVPTKHPTDDEEKFKYSLEEHLKTVPPTKLDDESVLEHYQYDEFGFLVPKEESKEFLELIEGKEFSDVLDDPESLESFSVSLKAKLFNDKREKEAKSTWMRAGLMRTVFMKDIDVIPTEHIIANAQKLDDIASDVVKESGGWGVAEYEKVKQIAEKQGVDSSSLFPF